MCYTPITTASRLAIVCRAYLRGNLSDRIFSGAVIEALGAGVDAKSVLETSGVVPSSLPRYASLVSAGFFA